VTFRNKILFSIWGVVLSLLVITFFIINYWTRSSIGNTFAGELHTSVSTIRVHESLQSEQLIRACLVLAESPRVRAVAELRDAETARQVLRDVSQTTLMKIVVLTDRAGIPLVQLLRGEPSSLDIGSSTSINNALHHVASTDVWAIDSTVFRVVSVPMFVDKELVGTLTIGFDITQTDIATLKKATASDIILLHGRGAVLSTLNPGETSSLLEAYAQVRGISDATRSNPLETPFDLKSSNETYMGAVFRLGHGTPSDSSSVSYLIVKSLSAELRRSLRSILGPFGIVSVVFLLLTAVIGRMISRSITKPIQDLVKGTTAISSGNYDYVIPMRGKDELSFLAAKFTEMSASLKEKVEKLGDLNAHLLERNKELDDTLQELRSAQEKLVRTERLAATGKLTAQLAHEINNPIHNIQSCLQTALTRLAGNTNAKELIEVAYEEAARLSRLTGQMLDIYRASAVDDTMPGANLREMLEEIVALTQAELEGDHITVDIHIEDDLPVIHGSKDKLKQVVLNLIANARDAMPEGGRLEIIARKSDRSAQIAVKDTGVGIAPENIGRIFEAFYTTKGTVSGVGLGLPVSYGIVSQHRGSIEVESIPGKGSTFTVILPFTS
jgi:signal transduction histidine kinase